MAVAPALACDKVPTSTSQETKSDSSLEISTTAALTEEPTPEKPVVAVALLRPAKVKAGDRLDLVIDIHIAAGWHIYAVDAPAGSAIPTAVVEKLAEGIEDAEAWQYPKAVPSPDTHGSIYEGKLTFRRPLRITSRAHVGSIDIACELTYQACDPFHCLPPQTMSLSAKGEIEAVR
jgi:DsbC/DsbD-like thiol-disulfide interchange protein